MSSIDYLESYLRTFSNRVGKVRGDTLDERVSFVMSRWEKVASDSESQIEEGNDTSEYRKQYAQTHRDAVKNIVEFLETFPEKDEAIEAMINAYRAIFFSPGQDPGKRDAAGYIVAELKNLT